LTRTKITSIPRNYAAVDLGKIPQLFPGPEISQKISVITAGTIQSSRSVTSPASGLEILFNQLFRLIDFRVYRE